MSNLGTMTEEQWHEKHGVPCVDCGKKVHPVTLPRLCDACVDSRNRKRSEARRGASSTPNAFANLRLDDPVLQLRVSPAAMTRAKDSVSLRRVVLLGPAGAGKTSLAAAMFRAWMDVNPSLVGYFALSWRLGLARAQHKLGEGEPECVEKSLEAELCVLDDLGSERQTATNAVPDVVFERHAEGKMLWVTTAMSQADVAGRYGDGIARRVFEGSRLIELGKSK